MILHTFGDSHCGHDWYNWNAVKIEGLEVKTHWKGPRTCAKFAMMGIKFMNIADDGVEEGDMVLFSFGEIDCREHIHSLKEDYKEAIEFIVRKYFVAIKDNVSKYNDLTVMVYCVPPIVRRDPISVEEYLIIRGTDKERVKYTKYFNEKIKEECEKYGYIYFDIYDKYCDEDGHLNPVYGDGNCHIKDPIYIQEELENILKRLS